MTEPDLKAPPRFRLANIPTPLEGFPLSPDPDSDVEIFIKRDDLTGSELTGNKIRKLEFIIYDAIARESDVILTCGAVGSNHCRAVAAIAARIGLDCELILRGKPPAIPDGNFLLDSLYNAKSKFVSDSEYEANIDGLLAKRAGELSKRGRKPYVIPEGASNILGMWGYFLAGVELKNQLEKAGLSADYIACAVGSGGTYAGLFMAAKYLEWPVKVIGYAVNRNKEYFRNKISRLIDEFLQANCPDMGFNHDEILIYDDYIGPGYAKIGQQEASFIRKVAANSGIILDPAYTGKAMLGMFDHIKKRIIKPKSTVVFIHTGGLLSIFPYRKQLLDK
jgi:D-cysteine desulfhydrase